MTQEESKSYVFLKSAAEKWLKEKGRNVSPQTHGPVVVRKSNSK